MRKISITILALLVSLGVFASNALAIDWVLSPDNNSLAFGVTVVAGTNEINFPYATLPDGSPATQPTATIRIKIHRPTLRFIRLLLGELEQDFHP